MRLVACFWPQDYFPEWGRGKRTSVYASKDGSAWRLRATVPAQFWSTLFVHQGGLGGRGSLWLYQEASTLMRWLAVSACLLPWYHEAGMRMRSWPCLCARCRAMERSSGAPAGRLLARTPSLHANRPPTATHAGAAYLLGVDDAEGPNSVSIARSTDGGVSWNRSALLPAPAGCHWATGAGEGCSA